jgi:hypothetical protein
MILRVALLLLACLVTAVAGPIVREAGAIYLSDFQEKLPRFRLAGPAPCYFEVSMQRYAGTLRFPQAVQLDAISAGGLLRVRGNAQQGGVAAWIEPHYVTGLPENYLEVAARAEQRRRDVEELIARKEVAIGMSLDEVTRSLGKPQKRSSKTGPEGSTQTYEYVKYKLIPQTVYTPSYVQSLTGSRPDPRAKLERVVVRSGYGYDASTVYLKVPVGTTTVGFVNGLVERVEESEGTLTGANASIVVPPINLVW